MAIYPPPSSTKVFNCLHLFVTKLVDRSSCLRCIKKSKISVRRRLNTTKTSALCTTDGKVLGIGLPSSLSVKRAIPPCHRSEEHTSELQSRENLVCRLLLE